MVIRRTVWRYLWIPTLTSALILFFFMGMGFGIPMSLGFALLVGALIMGGVFLLLRQEASRGESLRAAVSVRCTVYCHGFGRLNGVPGCLMLAENGLVFHPRFEARQEVGVELPLEALTAVAADMGSLVVETPGNAYVFDLPKCKRWKQYILDHSSLTGSEPVHVPSKKWEALKKVLTCVVCCLSLYTFLFAILMLPLFDSSMVLTALASLVLPSAIPLIWLKKRKIYLICWLCFLLLVGSYGGIRIGRYNYIQSITIDTTPNLNTSEYLPFAEDSKIVKLESSTLQLTEDLPIIDGAAAVFPVYSAFVHAVYPETTELHDGVFEYNNTGLGYQKLARKETDIFLGAKPSSQQVTYAEECGTTFQYTPIGSEAFVFFVHRNNPVETLTSQQIRDIYAGKITNWKEVGGPDEEIAAFQRNEGSGSQSMMLRFMGDTPLMEPETREIAGMGAIIRQVADYRSQSGSIGFSFRYYVEGMIQNPEIKMIAVDGVAPTVANIKNGTYPIVTPLYAVTWEGNPNANVEKLLNWMLSNEGQYIIEETGYAGITE